MTFSYIFYGHRKHNCCLYFDLILWCINRTWHQNEGKCYLWFETSDLEEPRYLKVLCELLIEISQVNDQLNSRTLTMCQLPMYYQNTQKMFLWDESTIWSRLLLMHVIFNMATDYAILVFVQSGKEFDVSRYWHIDVSR